MSVESPSSAAAVTETPAAIHLESSNDVIREGAPPSDAADDALAREDKNHTGTEMDHAVAHTPLEAPASSACLELLATNAKPVDDNHHPQQDQTQEDLAPDTPEGISLLGPEATEQPDLAKTSGPDTGRESEREGTPSSVASAASPSESGPAGTQEPTSAMTASSDKKQQEEQNLSNADGVHSCKAEEVAASDRDDGAGSPCEGSSYRESVIGDSETQCPAVEGEEDDSPAQNDVSAGTQEPPPAMTASSDKKQQEEQNLSNADGVHSCKAEEVAASDRDDGAGSPCEGSSYRESVIGDSEIQCPAVEGEEDDSPAQNDVSAAQKRCDDVREVSKGADGMGTEQSPASGNDDSAGLTHITASGGVEEMHPLQPPTGHDPQTSCGCASPAAETATAGKDSVRSSSGGDENFRGFLLVSRDAQHLVDEVISSSLAAFARNTLRQPELAVETNLPRGANASRETPPTGQEVNSEEVTRPLPADSQQNEPAPSPDSSLCKPLLVEITEDLISRVFEVVTAKVAAAAAEAPTHVAVLEVATTAERLDSNIQPETVPCDSPSASEGKPADGAIQPLDEARSDLDQLSLGSESPSKHADAMGDNRKSAGVHAAEVPGATGDDQVKSIAPATTATENSTPPRRHSSSSLHGTVVEEHALHEIPGLLAAEVVTAAISAAIPISSRACAPAGVASATPPSDSGAKAGTETAVETDSPTAGQDPASDLAARSAVVQQDSAEACPDDGDGDDLARCAEESPYGDGPRSPTPSSTREGEGSSTIDTEPERKAPSRAGLTAGGDGQPRHDSRSAEALLYLSEAGSRAKSRQQRSEATQVDASSWLRDAGGRALAAQGEEEAEGLEHAVVAEYVAITLQRVVAEEVVAVAGVAPVSRSTCTPETATGDQATPRVSSTLEPGTSEGDRLSNTGPELDSEPPCFVSSVADGDQSPTPGAVDASTRSTEDGSRAKSLPENVADTRVDASPRLRDPGGRTKSLQSVDEAALLERAVVTDYLSDVLTRTVEAEAATAGAAADASSSKLPKDYMMGKDQASPGAPYPRGDTEDAANGAEIDTKADGEISSGEDPDLAMHSTAAEVTATGEQEPSDQGDTSPKGGDDQSDKTAKHGSDGLQPPTPLCTPEEEGPNTDKPEIKLEVPSKAVLTADGGGSPVPRATEALAYLTEAGERAKSLQESSEKARLDASLWLRDTAGKALSREAVATAEPSSDTPPGTVAAEVAAAADPASSPSTASTPPADAAMDAQKAPAAPTCNPVSPEKEERISDVDQKPEEEKPSGEVSGAIGDRQSPSRESVEGLACLEEVGERGKEDSEGRRVDGSSFLRDTEGGTPSVKEDRKETAHAECVVVAEDLSETMTRDMAVEVAATAAATPAPTTDPADAGRDEATLGESDTRDRGAADVAETAVEADDITTTVREDSESAALRFSIVEAMAVVGQGSAGQRKASEADGGTGCVVDTSRGRPGSPTPPGTPEEERPGTSSLGLDPEVMFNPIVHPADHGQPPPPQSAETLACPAEAGLREEALREASEWLFLAGGRAKSAQDHAERAREKASSWLRDTGGRALSLQGRDNAGRLECAAWLRLTGRRAKSAQDHAVRAREEASSWLRDTASRLVSLQDRAEGVRSDAAAWLATRGASELEQTAPTKRPAEDATAAEALVGEVEGGDDGQGIGESKSLQGSPTQGGIRPGSPSASSPSQPEKPSAAAEPEEVVAGASDRETIGEARSPNDEETVTSKERLPTVGKGYRAEHIDDNTSTPSPAHDQTLSPAESDAAAAAAITTANTAAVDPTAELTMGRTASSDRTAPVPWQEPATTTPPDRGGSFAPTAAGPEDLGRMLDAGEKEWSRVSLSRTPPFDALNSPSLPQRYAPVRGRPRPLPPEVKAEAVAGAGAGVGPNADGLGWFFAPPDQMAPKGDAYRGSDSFHSAEASASTTVRADSSGSFVSPSPGGSGGTDDGRRPRRRDNGGSGDDHASTRCSDGGGGGGGGVWQETTWIDGLGNVVNPAREAQCRMMNRAAAAAAAGGEGHAHLGGGERRSEETGSPSLGSRNTRGSGNRWHKKVEQSRQYLRRWEVFLSRAHRHFDGEADVRKRLSVIRRAHPDVSNEVAFVALAQSRGRSSEAAAVLHLPRAKDEAALVAMMLDVAAFIGLAREAAERRRRSRQLEHQRRRMETVAGGAAKRPAHNHQAKGEHRQQPSHQRQHHRQQEERCSHPQDHRRDSTEDQQRLKTYLWEQQQRQKQGEEQRSGHEWARDDASTGVIGDAAENSWHSQQCNRQDYDAEPISAGGGAGRSRGEAQSRRSDSAPSLLPPIDGWLMEGTPPSPSSLKTVLSTSTSVAVGVPSGFGLASVAGAASKGEGENIVRVRGSKSTRRELRAILRARARWQSQRMAEMATPGAEQRQQQGWGGSGLDALAERFLRETDALDRDSRDLETRLRGRQRIKPGSSKLRGPHQGGGGRGERRVFGNDADDAAWRVGGGGGGGGGDGVGGRRGDRGRGGSARRRPSLSSSSSMFLASVNRNPNAPFMSLETPAAVLVDGGSGVCTTSSSAAAAALAPATAAAPVASFGVEANGGEGSESCRVQSYFTQAGGGR